GINGTALSGVSLFAGSGGGQQSYGPESTGGTFCGGQASTDQNVSYNITGLSAGGYMLNVMPQLGSGYGQEQLGPDQQITLNSSSAVEKDFNLSLVGYVQGYVLGNSSNGTLVPLPGASISFYSPTPNGGWAGGITDDSGFFNISATPGSYDMQVNPPEEGGYSSYQSGHQNGGGVNVTSGSINNIGNITLRQGARITGYVLFNGTGVPNVGVNAFRQTNTPGMPSDMGFGFTNGSGYFFIAGLTGNATYQVQAYPDPSSPYSSGMTSVYLSETGASVNITLVQGNTVNGTVTCNGFPVQNAPVMLFKNSGTGNSGPEQMLGTMNPGSFAFAMADSSGNYLARGLTAGNYTMRVELPYGLSYNCSSYINGSVEIIGPTPLDVEMPLAATLSGHVNGTNGVNISGAFVSAFVPSLSGGPESGPSGYGQTDAGGNYVLRLSPGSTYMVTVQPPWGSSYASQAAPVQVNSSGAAYSKNFTLSSGGGIKGKVVDSNGNAVQFAFVNAFSQSAQSFGFVNTQPDGTFDVRGLSPANDFKVFIQPPSTTGGIVPTFIDDVAVTDGNETDLGTINATSATAFMLANISNAGIGIASADVHAWIPFTPYYSSCTTNSSGQCNLTGLAAGTYDVFIDAPGLPQVFSNATVSNGANSFNFDYASRGATYTVNG
ncbi:MAG TPA: carboxypeptidase-like regulatory domain-containing protein, partial [Candidatus Micrarchaeota archaeon]|nr:carboxypeptidase-like regulatory domain-containing protein [Candidatus Micrarchaeota archaeon]